MKGYLWRGVADMEARPGSHIKDVAADAIELAAVIHGTVHFRFNGISFRVTEESTAAEVEQNYQNGVSYERGRRDSYR